MIEKPILDLLNIGRDTELGGQAGIRDRGLLERGALVGLATGEARLLTMDRGLLPDYSGCLIR